MYPGFVLIRCGEANRSGERMSAIEETVHYLQFPRGGARSGLQSPMGKHWESTWVIREAEGQKGKSYARDFIKVLEERNE